MADENQNTVLREVRMDSAIYPEQTFVINCETYYPLYGEIENIPPIKRTLFKQYNWQLAGSGSEALKQPNNEYTMPETGQSTTDELNNTINPGNN